MNGFIETFHIDWRLMIAQLFNFGIVFLAFYLLAAKPLRKLMKERGEEIETGLQNAKAGMEMIQKAKEEYEENTIKLRKQSIDTQKELKKEFERIKKNEEEYVKNRDVQYEIEKKALIESAKVEIVSLATLAAEKIMDKKNQ